MTSKDAIRNSAGAELQAVIEAALRLTNADQIQLLEFLNARSLNALAEEISAGLEQLLSEINRDGVLFDDRD